SAGTVPVVTDVIASENTSPPSAASAETAAPVSDSPRTDVGARIREKLTSHADDQAVGSSDGGKPRQERSQGGPPVEIPTDGELDASLEAQIAAAMTADTSAPVETAPVVGVEAEDDEAPLVEELGPGSQLKGTVQQIHGENVFIDAGVRSGVVVPLRQFAENKQPSVGDELTVILDSVDEDGLFKARIPQGRHKAGGNWDALAVGQVVDCMVAGTNKGGLQVTVSTLKGFMPASQVDLGYVADLETYVGQKLSAQITEVNKKKRNLVLSRRVLLQAERESQQGDFWASLEVGQDHEGVVKTIKDYGAFVNLGPMDGFLHIGEMAWSRINHPNEAVSVGQTIQVKILKLDADRQRVSLGMKQLIQNPWLSATERYAPERIVSGKVTRIAEFGAFVELEPGIEGLVHISELAWRRVGRVNDVLSMGEDRDFQVIEVDPKRKRISLSVKALEKQPDAPAVEDRKPTAPRKPNPHLRGGNSESKGGKGLFGNPSDFT
ncbi:MAG: S1 RNA-binding domain-containing protein, partial [Planctomycetaceae bacterium]